VSELTRIDPWFVAQFHELARTAADVRARGARSWTRPRWRASSVRGSVTRKLADLAGVTETDVRGARLAVGIRSVYQRVDTCAAEFESLTPYLYSTYESSCEADPTPRPKVVILGSGPNRIGRASSSITAAAMPPLPLPRRGWRR